MGNNRLLELAIRGLKAELAELETELLGAGRQLAKSEAIQVDRPKGRRRRKMSAEVRARISAAQKARWAKRKGK